MAETAPAPAPPRLLGRELAVADVVRRPGGAVSIRFDAPADAAEDFAYRAGQFLTVQVPIPDAPVARCYSLSSVPGLDDRLEITVKGLPGGVASSWLVENARAGLPMRSMAPSGLFVVPEAARGILLVGGGSGVTPLYALARSALAFAGIPVTLLLVDHGAGASIFGPELDDLAARHPERFRLERWVTAERGRRPVAADVRGIAEAATWSDAFACGPDGLLDVARETLAHSGPGRRLHVEDYESLEGDPFLLEAAEPEDEPAESADVVIGGVEHRVEWPAGSTLVDVLLRRGIPVPYSCREGDCGSCTSRLVEGRVAMACTTALEPEDIDDGYILACQSRPLEGPLRVEF